MELNSWHQCKDYSDCLKSGGWWTTRGKRSSSNSCSLAISSMWLPVFTYLYPKKGGENIITFTNTLNPSKIPWLTNKCQKCYWAWTIYTWESLKSSDTKVLIFNKIFNLSLKLDALQENWEIVNITSIFTKGNQSQEITGPLNYHLLPLFKLKLLKNIEEKALLRKNCMPLKREVLSDQPIRINLRMSTVK